jgi:hypothetical protein
MDLSVSAGDGINNIVVSNSANSSLTIANGVSINQLDITSSATLRLLSNTTFGTVNVTNGTLSTNPHDALYSGSTWTNAAAPGNGQLIFTVNGTLTVGASGKINVDGLGYAGGTTSRYQGGSDAGPGANLTTANGGGGGGGATGCSAGCTAAGGGYGTAGTTVGSNIGGNAFGAGDFATKLYLGSGGGYSTSTYSGGAGGGAIKIVANAMTLATGAQVTAKGLIGNNNGARYGGSGSGGTIVLTVSGTFSNSGTISVAGGAGTGAGGTGRTQYP